jgi:hypothetical protein
MGTKLPGFAGDVRPLTLSCILHSPFSILVLHSGKGFGNDRPMVGKDGRQAPYFGYKVVLTNVVPAQNFKRRCL